MQFEKDSLYKPVREIVKVGAVQISKRQKLPYFLPIWKLSLNVGTQEVLYGCVVMSYSVVGGLTGALCYRSFWWEFYLIYIWAHRHKSRPFCLVTSVGEMTAPDSRNACLIFWHCGKWWHWWVL